MVSGIINTTRFIMTRDINGYNGYGLAPSSVKKSVTLDANTEATFVTPADNDNYLVIFSIQPGSTVWVAYGETAEVPAGNTVTSTTSELNPVARFLPKSTTVSLITANTTADVGITIYAV